jgi:hypothetical protein
MRIKLIAGIRDMKKAVINNVFDKEKRHLIDYHQKRAKKNKASKKIVIQIMKLKDTNRDMILKYYFEKKAQQNMITAINFCALKYMDNGLRPDGLYDDNEHRNLLMLTRNIHTLDTFLFKGVKEQEPVGVPEPDLYDLDNRPDKKKIREAREAAVKQTVTKVIKKKMQKTFTK